MATSPPFTDPRFDPQYDPSYQEKKKRSPLMSCLLGCLVVGLVMLVLAVVAAYYVYRNSREWAADFASQVVAAGIDASQLPQQEKDEIKFQVNRVVTEFREGSFWGAQVSLIMKKLSESPLIPSLMVAAIDKAYITKSGLSDDEKAAARVTVQRFLRGMMDDKIPKPAVDAAMAHVATQQNGNWHLKEQVTDAELRAFLETAKSEADKANIEPLPADFDPSEEAKRIIDEALNQPPELDMPQIELPPIERGN